MLGLTGLDRLARNGDGLVPEMRALLERLAAANASNVTDLARYRSEARVQAGPNPVAAADRETADVVVLYRAPAGAAKSRRK